MIPEPANRVLLVYPPFGPAGLPSLGLGLLSAAVKRAGIECRTYYWNLNFLSRLPGPNTGARMQAYWWLTGRAWHPFSEWIFARMVHGEALGGRDGATVKELRRRGEELRGLGVESRDLERLRDEADDLMEDALQRVAQYSIVGIATTFFQNLPALALARRIKERWPGKTVVLGGANCEGEMGSALLARFPYIDHVFSGEVDGAFPEFVRRKIARKAFDDLPGILSRRAPGDGIAGCAAAPVHNLDDLPLPDFDDFFEQREQYGVAECQSATVALESSRGCWWGARHHCVFCGLNANGMGYRKKGVDRFRWEVEETVRRYAAQHVFMTDNILPLDYYDGFLGSVRVAAPGARFFYEIKSNARRPQVAKLAEAGVTAVQPGIESFSSSLLGLMRKGVSGAQNVAFLRYAREYGVRASYNLLVGFPGSDARQYRRMAESLPSLYHLRPPSGVVPIEFHRFSPYHQRPEEFGLKLRPDGAYASLYPYGEDGLAQIAYIFRSDSASPADSVIEELSALVSRWQSVHREDDCTLTWRARLGEIRIEDRRPDFGPAEYSLQGYAREVFHQLDEPRAASALQRGARAAAEKGGADSLLEWLFEPEIEPGIPVIRFGADAFAADPHGCLKPLLAAGLLFEDAGDSSPDLVGLDDAAREPRFVALPVHCSYTPEDASWNAVGV